MDESTVERDEILRELTAIGVLTNGELHAELTSHEEPERGADDHRNQASFRRLRRQALGLMARLGRNRS
jgi:hypothetical protein